MCSHTNKPNIDIQQRYNLLSGSLRVLLVDISKKHIKEFNEIEKFLMCNYENDKGAE